VNAGLSQRELAKVVGVPSRTVQRLEAGLGARPAMAKKVADFFDVFVTDLMPIDRDRSAA
jgi:transcriptional regulator with XRE-family HTH domain